MNEISEKSNERKTYKTRAVGNDEDLKSFFQNPQNKEIMDEDKNRLYKSHGLPLQTVTNNWDWKNEKCMVPVKSSATINIEKFNSVIHISTKKKKLPKIITLRKKKVLKRN